LTEREALFASDSLSRAYDIIQRARLHVISWPYTARRMAPCLHAVRTMPSKSTIRELFQALRAGAAGAFATAIDLGVLATLVTGFHLDARVASVPALLAGGLANFLGNRHFAFRAREGSILRQAALYTVVEAIGLAYAGVLYDVALRLVPHAAQLYWALRLVTSHIVFLTWSYPLWRRVFATPSPAVAI
jgi:putative flippase GtrA